GLLREDVLERILSLKRQTGRIDKLQLLELQQDVLEVGPVLGHLGKHNSAEYVADHGGQLEEVLQIVVEPIDTRQEHALHRRWKSQGLRRHRHRIAAVLADELSTFQERQRELFDEEGIAVGRVVDQPLQRGWDRRRSQNLLRQRRAVLPSQAGQT